MSFNKSYHKNKVLFYKITLATMKIVSLIKPSDVNLQ